MRLSASLLQALKRLAAGETIAASSLRDDMAGELKQEGLLTTRVHGSRRSYTAIDPGALRVYLGQHYDALRDLDAASPAPSGRAAQAAVSGNSKCSRVRSCPGFPVNTLEPICCLLCGESVELYPPPGSFAYITDWQSFELPADVVVVGVENMENFRLVRLQREFFERELPGRRLLFVPRYPQSADLACWLGGISNEYVHFGDLDLAGINIFLTEFLPHTGTRGRFLIPSDAERRIARGTVERYNAQLARFRNLQASDPALQQLIDTIHRHHRGYDQEGYVSQSKP